ncbi:tail fiber domain-containing protein [Bdellovibrio bacteriovorus]|uniref:tail fiber domain-containing protein n=1 Tax=Bdellovibrio bacteriovorus TaxID=959 RepID=UPI0035A61DB6
MAVAQPALGVGTNGQILAADSAEATGLKWITPNAGTVTTVSATAPLSVTTASTTPAISIADGTINGQTLRWNAGAWSANKLLYTDLLNVNSLSPWPSSSCTAGQAVVWISGSDSFACSSITVSGSNFAAQSANTFLAGPTTGSAAPSFRTIASSDLPVTGAGGIYTNGGNSFGTASSLGTNDNQSLTFKTNNTAKLTVLANGAVGIGTTNPTTRLEVVSNSPTGIDVRTTGSTNNSISTGAIRILGTASGGTGAAGFGAVQQFLLTNSAGTETLAADAGAVWNSAAPGSENGAYIIRTGIGGTVTEKLRIDSNGSVGIGTNDPQSTLDVNGAIRVGTGTCNAAKAGSIQYDQTTGTAQVCSGGKWIPVGTGTPVPPNSQLVFQTCPTGWTEMIGAGPNTPSIQVPTGTNSKLCQSPATPSVISANSIIPMMNCPSSWTNLGFVNNGSLSVAGFAFSLTACQSPAYDVGLPEGVTMISGSGSCPTNWTQLGAAAPSSQCNGSTCVICESPGNSTAFPRVVWGGNSGNPTGAGTQVFVRGGNGGSTSGNGGGVHIMAGIPVEGNGGAISISATNGLSTGATARAGGNVTISAANGANGGGSGSISLTAGSSTGAGGVGGPISLQAGSGASSTRASVNLQSMGGNVGIGTTTPDTKLVLDLGSTPLDGDQSLLKMKVVGDFSAIGGGNATSQAQIGFSGVEALGGMGTGAAMYFKHSTPADLSAVGEASGGNYIFKGTASPTDIVFKNGKIGIGTTGPSYNLHVVGTAGLSTGTAWTNASDARLKDIHGDYEYGLNEVLKLHTVRYNYKKDNPLGLESDFEKTGFIAQEVQKVIPDAVKERKDGYLELNVDPIHWAVVNAIKDLYRLWFDDAQKTNAIVAKQAREIASVKSENLRLKKENADIKARLDRIEKLLSESK